MELQLEHVSKHFGDKRAGKTTLMRIIAGIMKSTSKETLYNGIPIAVLGERYREIFGYLPQEFGFHHDFTVRDYLEYVAALKGLSRRQSQRRINELLEQVSLDEVRGKKISKLSGGMKRRVGIARKHLCRQQ